VGNGVFHGVDALEVLLVDVMKEARNGLGFKAKVSTEALKKGT
jgi:hypothetical protein